MRTSSPIATPLTNWLLASLPDEDRRRLGRDLLAVTIRPRQPLQRQGERVQRIYFLHSGLCSMSRETASGQTVEIASVGKEGLVGISAALGNGAEDSMHTTMIVGGEASCMSVDAFRREMDGRGSLHDIVQRYLHAFCSSMMIEAACKALHPIDQRLARWLLETGDRLQDDVIPLTQETVASALGVRRASITVATSILEHLGMVEHAHRRICLRNRPGLATLACECYDALRLARRLSPDSVG